jgi:hypothetical protein
VAKRGSSVAAAEKCRGSSINLPGTPNLASRVIKTAGRSHPKALPDVTALYDGEGPRLLENSQGLPIEEGGIGVHRSELPHGCIRIIQAAGLDLFEKLPEKIRQGIGP